MPLLKLLSLVAVLAGRITATPPSPDTTTSMWPLQSFKSTGLQPPYMNVAKRGQTEQGYLFPSPQDTLRSSSWPTIYSDDGQLVWQGPNSSWVSAFQPQMLYGEQVLAYWTGNFDDGHGWGSITIMNGSYDEVYKVTLSKEEQNLYTSAGPQDSYIDIHESHITDQGSILVTAVNYTRADISAVGGPKDGWVMDGLIYEIDIKTNDILFHWSVLDHRSEIPITNAEVPLDGKGVNKSEPWAYAHLNSVIKYGDNYLVSSRYMCSIFFISGRDGHVIWQLDGRTGGDFTLGRGSAFCFQHDPRFAQLSSEKAILHMHNNDNDDYSSPTHATTGLVLDLYFKERTATVRNRLWNAHDIYFAYAQGSYQNLTNGHVLLQHGTIPVIEEYDANGACVMTARFGKDDAMMSYRAYRSPWVGTPRTKPDIVACREQRNEDDSETTAAYVSWNGATGVQAWKIYGGSDKGMRALKSVPKNGFETRVELDGNLAGDALMVQAVGGPNGGKQSEVVSIGKGC